jgi:acylphosphatase
MGAPVARKVTLHGHVQGVFFRASTRRVAQEQGVTGWVANRADGAVVAWLEGDADAVETVEAWMVTGGPPAAEVDEVDVEAVAPQGFARFEVRHGVG